MARFSFIHTLPAYLLLPLILSLSALPGRGAPIATLLTSSSFASPSSLYTLSKGWPQGMPSNATRFTAVAVVEDSVIVAQRGTAFPQPFMAFDRTTGALVSAFGRAAVAGGGAAGFGEHGLNAALLSSGKAMLWVTDVVNHTISLLSLEGQSQARLGTPGQAGTKLSPLQFGNVADVSFDVLGLRAFVSDGDGGVNNRVLALDMSGSGAPTLLWATGTNGSSPGQFSSPHTLVYHVPSNTVLVGDRGNARIQQLDADTGSLVSVWDMAPAKPWGLRYVFQRDLLLMADGDNQVCGGGWKGIKCLAGGG